jgi:hypothetical protein
MRMDSCIASTQVKTSLAEGATWILCLTHYKSITIITLIYLTELAKFIIILNTFDVLVYP